MNDAPQTYSYDTAYGAWLRDPHAWWAAAAEGIAWAD